MNIAIAAREPIATRELRQAARQKRGPILLGGISLAATIIALIITSAMTSSWSTATDIGPAVFEGMFAIATFVVVIVGATVAASSVASEREGHTWEALLLSGLRPAAIARGKFLSAFAQAVLYLVALAPSTALSFLVGGVGITEIVVAFVMLLGVAALAVVFGLAVSSYASTARGALAGALIATLVVGPGMYGLFVGLGVLTGEGLGAHEGRGATWLAHAIAAAPFGGRFLVLFVINPLVALVVPGWLVFEVTKANLSDSSDDRSTGVRRWYVVATLLLVGAAIATLAAVPSSRELLMIGLLFLVALHLGGSALVFGGEPLGPSRRVRARWERAGGASFTQKLFGPGIVSATVLHAALGSAALAIVYGAGTLLGGRSTGLTVSYSETAAIAAGYAIGIHLFVAGATGALATRCRPGLVRGLIVVMTMTLTVVPLVVGSVGRAMSSGATDSWRLVDALSPLFTLAAGTNPDRFALTCAQASACGYGFVGLALLFVTYAVSRSRGAAARP